MKRRRTNLILCSLAFLVSVFAEVYCFLEFREDILTVLGTGVIVLVTAFLTLDSILSITGSENKGDSESWSHLGQRLEEIEKLQKATGIMLKKDVIKQREMIGKLSTQMVQQKEVIVKTGKLIAKHHREDTEKMLALLQEIAEKPVFDELGILQTIDANFHSASLQIDKLIAEMEQMKDKIGSVPSNYIVNETVSEIKEAAASNEVLSKSDAAIESSEAEPAPTVEPVSTVGSTLKEPVSTIDTSDPNKMMSPDDIAALLASMGGEETTAEAEPAPTVEPEPKESAPKEPELTVGSTLKEPVSTIDTSDPNKMMSPDDIAALLASMGQ